MKKILSVLLMFVMISFVTATTIEENNIHSAIIPELNHPAEVELVLNDILEGDYDVFTLNNVLIKPIESFKLSKGSNILKLKVYPTSALDVLGNYAFTYNLRKTTGEIYESTMNVKIVPVTEAFEVSSGPIDLDTNSFKFYIKNKADANLENLSFKFSSQLFNLEKTISLNAFETKWFDVEVENFQKVEAGSYLVDVDVKTPAGWKSFEGKIFIGEKKGIESSEDVSGFFIKTQRIERFNKGNVIEEVLINVNRGAFSRLFTTFNIAPDNVNRDGLSVTYSWNKKLGPGEKIIIKAKTNYFIPFLILLALVLLYMGYKKYTTKKLEILKSVSPVRTKGGHFALRVKLLIKAKESLENVSLIDKIPNIVKVHEKFETSKPDKIDVKNRRIEWNLGDLQANEERSFSYIVYSKIGIVGKFALPEAVSVFEKEGEIHEVKSNSVYFLSEQTSKD